MRQRHGRARADNHGIEIVHSRLLLRGDSARVLGTGIRYQFGIQPQLPLNRRFHFLAQFGCGRNREDDLPFLFRRLDDFLPLCGAPYLGGQEVWMVGQNNDQDRNAFDELFDHANFLNPEAM